MPVAEGRVATLICSCYYLLWHNQKMSSSCAPGKNSTRNKDKWGYIHDPCQLQLVQVSLPFSCTCSGFVTAQLCMCTPTRVYINPGWEHKILIIILISHINISIKNIKATSLIFVFVSISCSSWNQQDSIWCRWNRCATVTVLFLMFATLHVCLWILI